MNPPVQTLGVMGLGLLGRGIVTCALGHGLEVVALTRTDQTRNEAREHIDCSIHELIERAGFDPRLAANWPSRYTEAHAVEDLAACDFVIESVSENLKVKQDLFDQLENVIPPDVTVASNTSAIPITVIQQTRRHPQRFVGMHWGEPAHILRFLEIIRGEHTSDKTFQQTVELAEALGKQPSLVEKDIRGFITNRLMYAMMREALYLLESGVADAQTIDRSFCNDIGWWATIAGPFRWMDLTGLPGYAAVMKDLFPELANTQTLPETMQRMLDTGAGGVRNGTGFYSYTPEEAAAWKDTWVRFTWDIKTLADRHAPLPATRSTTTA